MSYEKLGRVYEEQGDHAQAAAAFRARFAHRGAGDPPDSAVIYQRARRLAYLCDVLGEQEAAVGYYETAIRAGGQLPAVSYSDLGTLLNNVALIYRKSGRQKAAEPYYLHALELYEKQLGPDHPDVAAVLNNLGVFYTNERRFYGGGRDASARARDSHAGKSRGPRRHRAIEMQSGRGLSFARRLRERAEELYRESLEPGKSWAKACRRTTRSCVSNYADLLRSLGKAAQGRISWKRGRAQTKP